MALVAGGLFPSPLGFGLGGSFLARLVCLVPARGLPSIGKVCWSKILLGDCAGWHYVEYERSARYRSRVSGKIRGYGSARRRDRYPVILVCWDDKAERQFQEQGLELGISMVTTTLERLKDHGPVGNTLCWSMYGQPVRLG